MTKYNTEEKLMNKLAQQSLTVCIGGDDVGFLSLEDEHLYLFHGKTGQAHGISYEEVSNHLKTGFLFIV